VLSALSLCEGGPLTNLRSRADGTRSLLEEIPTIYAVHKT
jgi:hypothetical protein